MQDLVAAGWGNGKTSLVILRRERTTDQAASLAVHAAAFALPADRVLRPVHPEWAQYLQIRRLSAWADSAGGIFHFAPAFDRM